MSVTAVPLRPVAKGSVPRLWLAIVLVLAVAGVLVWAGLSQFGTTKSGLRYQVLREGSGANATMNDVSLVAYKGMLPNGTVFDQNERAPVAPDQMIPGFAEALTLMKKDGRLRVWMPASLAYGDSPPPGIGIPAGSPLIFEIRLIDFRSRAEVEAAQRQMQMQEMMRRQMMQQGMPGGAAPGR